MLITFWSLKYILEKVSKKNSDHFFNSFILVSVGVPIINAIKTRFGFDLEPFTAYYFLFTSVKYILTFWLAYKASSLLRLKLSHLIYMVAFICINPKALSLFKSSLLQDHKFKIDGHKISDQRNVYFFLLDGFGGRVGNKLIGLDELNDEIEKSLESTIFFHDKSYSDPQERILLRNQCISCVKI